jgi:hypothetical protein
VLERDLCCVWEVHGSDSGACLILILAINVAKYAGSVITVVSRYVVIIHELYIYRGLCICKGSRHGLHNGDNFISSRLN